MTDPLRATPPMPTTPTGTDAAADLRDTDAAGGSGAGDDAKARAGAAADAVKGAGSDIASTASDKAKDVAEETKRQVRDLGGEARDTMSQQVSQQHQNAIKNLRALGDEFSSMSGATDHNGVGANLVSQAGDHAHRIADWIDSREPSQIVDEVRSFARRRPGAFLAGALVAGIAAGRLTRGVVDTHRDDTGSGSDLPASGGSASTDDVHDNSYGTPPAYSAGTSTADLPVEPALPPTGGLASPPLTGFPRQGGI